MSYKPIATYGPLASNADAAVVFQFTGNGQEYDTFYIGSSAGSMRVFASGDGINVLASPLGLLDLCTTTPSTVLSTTATRHYRLTGRFKALVITQNGATAVANAYVIATESA